MFVLLNQRRNSLRSVLLGSVLVGSSVVPFYGANADEANGPTRVAADVPAPALQITAPVNTDAPKADEGLGEVTVTARFRKENLQDVPVAITALSGDDWADKSVKTLQSVQFSVPGVIMNLSNPRQTQTSIRALGTNPAGDGLASSVGYYVDGVYYDRPGMAAIDFYDLSQIEVLKGPQGTLFGKNNTAGAISFTTNQPTFKQEITGETSFGNYGTENFMTVFNTPLFGSDKVAVRFMFYDDNHDGYIKDINSVAGNQYNNSDRQGARLQFLYRPDENFDLLFRNDYAIQHDQAGASILYSAGPTTLAAGGLYKKTFAQAQAIAGTNAQIDPNSYLTDANAPQKMLTFNYGNSIEANWHLDGGYTITSITAFRNYDFSPRNDNTDAVTANASLQNFYSTQGREKEQEVTQELRWSSPVGGKLDYIAGAYYLWRRENTYTRNFYPNNWAAINGSTSTYQDGENYEYDADETTKSYALFTQANYHFDSQWAFTSGLRYSFEENTQSTTQYAPISYNTAGVGFNATGNGYYHGTIGSEDFHLAELETLSYKPVEHILSYVTLSHGAKAAGTNTNVPAFNSTTNSFASMATELVQPEKAYNAELGVKTSWPSQHLTFNTDLFLTKVFGYQSNVRETVNGTPTTLIVNAGTAQTQGWELESHWKPTENLTVSFSGAFDVAQYKSYRQAQSVEGSASQTQDLTGSAMVNAPKWSYTTNSTYVQPITDDTFAYAGIEYAWKDWQYGNVDDSTYSKIQSYGLTNLRIGVQINEKIDAALYVENLFNTAYYYSVGNLYASGAAGYAGVPGDPRIIGANLKVKLN